MIVTPRILSEFSQEMPGSDGGGVAAVFRLGFRKTISLVFDTFSFKLYATANYGCDIVYLQRARWLTEQPDTCHLQT